MLLPAIGFIVGCVVFGIIGAVVLPLRPTPRSRVRDLPIFVAGALGNSAVAGGLYGLAFATPNGLLESRVAIFAMFTVLLVAGSSGGLCAVAIFRRFRAA